MKFNVFQYLGIFLSINLLFSCQNSSNQASLSQESKGENSQTTSIAKSSLPDTKTDTNTLTNILTKSNFINQMNQWNGKALFIKVNDQKKPNQFTYYYYNSIYQDTNNNQIQDSQDQGFFNPASTVKVGLSALVLEKLNQKKLGRETEYRITGTSQWYSISEDIKKALVISDNEATNRLILFLGFDYLNQQMRQKGISSFTVNRLMLNKGTRVNSPGLELRFKGKIIKQPVQNVSQKFACFEVEEKLGNCANATDLAEILIRLVQPDVYPAKQRFNIQDKDRIWLQQIMSQTPKKSGFDYPNTYCRFLDPLGQKIASKKGKLLNKCGIGLFSHTFVDSSFLETDQGDKFYIVFVLNPPQNISQSQSVDWMNQVTEMILPQLK